MLQNDFAGTVVVNGSERRLEVSGNPLGRTIVRLDGITIYDKKPFIQKETIDFNIVPGKPASLRWQQVSVAGYECDVTVDGRVATLPKIRRDGTTIKPVGAKQRQNFQVQAAGFAFLGLGVMSLVLNYFDLQRGYYWTTLGMEPLAICLGIFLIVKPDVKLSDKHSQTVFALGGVINLIVGYFFRSWFIGQFLAR